MEDKYHKGYRVSVKSCLSGTRWRPDVRVIALRHGASGAVTIGPPPSLWSAATEDEADRYGLQMARMWIDCSRSSGTF